MEGFKLDISTLITQQVHHELEVRLRGDVPGHDREVGSIEEDLPQELQTLSLRDVILRKYQRRVRREELSWLSDQTQRS